MSNLLLGLMVLTAAWSNGDDVATTAVENVTVIQTSRTGDKLRTVATGKLEDAAAVETPLIELDPGQKFQTLVGIGGSFTESSAHVLKQLSPGHRDSVIEAYFGRDGAAYSLTRTHMGSCDFSLDHYAYTDDDDEVLASFSISHDLDDLIPLIKDAMKTPGADFKIIASPWTAPPWMKDNDSWYGGSLRPGMEPVWAAYMVKYLAAYRDQGISIWGLTPENEPLGNGAHWDSMHFTPQSMRDFIKNHLGPRLARDAGDTKLLIYDQNRDHVEEWVDVILGDPEAAQHVWGTAVHWYSSTFDWYPDALQRIHDRFPTKHILHSEGCVDNQVPVWRDDDWYWRKEATDWGYTWAQAENKHLHPEYVPVYRYARDIIGGLNSWLTGWIDWNIVLDTRGGPNLADNWCCAPVIAKPETDEIYFTPLFYTLAHFSKYLRPGARRIAVTSELAEVMVTAVENPDGSFAAVILNQHDEPLDYVLRIGGRQMDLNIPGEALQTVVVNR